MKLRHFLDKSLVVEETAEIICFVLLFLTIVVQVFFRFKPVSDAVSYAPIWTEELSRWLYVYIVFLGAGVGIHRKEHIAIDFFAEKLRPAARLVLGLFTNSLIVFCCAIFVYYGNKNAAVVWYQQSHTMPFFTYGVLYIIVPISFFLMSVRTLGVMILSVLDFKNAKKAGG